MPKKLAVLALGVLSALCVIGCGHPNYDVEVYPGEEGTYTLKRVPLQNPPPAQPTAAPQSSAAAQAPATFAPQPTTDPDLADVEKMWPTLSPSDRQTVKNLVHRLANQP